MKINTQAMTRVKSFLDNPKTYAAAFAATVSVVIVVPMLNGAADLFNHLLPGLTEQFSGLTPIETGNPASDGMEILSRAVKGEIPMSWDPVETPWSYYLGLTALLALTFPPYIFFGLSRALGRKTEKQEQEAA